MDGRTGLAALREDSADVVVVDAYAEGRVPGDHLAARGPRHPARRALVDRN
ncbi:hypothetical protein HOQ23_14090 [Nocardioides sp. zg-DK7169]|nr:hypothetical protein [Nocardioides sp. zg-DK7169]